MRGAIVNDLNAQTKYLATLFIADVRLPKTSWEAVPQAIKRDTVRTCFTVSSSWMTVRASDLQLGVDIFCEPLLYHHAGRYAYYYNLPLCIIID